MAWSHESSPHRGENWAITIKGTKKIKRFPKKEKLMSKKLKKDKSNLIGTSGDPVLVKELSLDQKQSAGPASNPPFAFNEDNEYTACKSCGSTILDGEYATDVLCKKCSTRINKTFNIREIEDIRTDLMKENIFMGQEQANKLAKEVQLREKYEAFMKAKQDLEKIVSPRKRGRPRISMPKRPKPKVPVVSSALPASYR